jgi:hypothetical protein
VQAKAVGESVARLAAVLESALVNEWLREDVYLPDGEIAGWTHRMAVRRAVRKRQRQERAALAIYQEGFMARACGRPEQWRAELDAHNYFYDKPAMWLAGYHAADDELREAADQARSSN